MTGVGDFGCRLTDLVELISERGDHGLERLHVRFGGLEGLAKKLGSDLHNGIPGTDKDMEERARVFGRNRVPPPRSKGLLELMWEALHDQTLIILLIAGAISLILGGLCIVFACIGFFGGFCFKSIITTELTIGEDKTIGWIEGFAIMVSVFIVTFVTAVNDIQKEKQFKELQAKQNAEKLTDVIRGGKQITVSEFDLLVRCCVLLFFSFFVLVFIKTIFNFFFKKTKVGDLWVVTIGAIIPADGVLVKKTSLF